MQEAILKHSKFATFENNYGSYDIVEYNGKFHCGTNLFKYFTSYLTKQWQLPVLVLEDEKDAYNHFNSTRF